MKSLFILLFMPFITLAQKPESVYSGATVTAIASQRAYGAAIGKVWQYEQGFMSVGMEGLVISAKPMISVQAHGGIYIGRFFLVAGAGAGSFIPSNYTAYAEGGAGVEVGRVQVSALFRTGVSKINEGVDVEGWYLRVSFGM